MEPLLRMSCQPRIWMLMLSLSAGCTAPQLITHPSQGPHEGPFRVETRNGVKFFFDTMNVDSLGGVWGSASAGSTNERVVVVIPADSIATIYEFSAEWETVFAIVAGIGVISIISMVAISWPFG